MPNLHREHLKRSRQVLSRSSSEKGRSIPNLTQKHIWINKPPFCSTAAKHGKPVLYILHLIGSETHRDVAYNGALQRELVKLCKVPPCGYLALTNPIKSPDDLGLCGLYSLSLIFAFDRCNNMYYIYIYVVTFFKKNVYMNKGIIVMIFSKKVCVYIYICVCAYMLFIVHSA